MFAFHLRANAHIVYKNKWSKYYVWCIWLDHIDPRKWKSYTLAVKRERSEAEGIWGMELITRPIYWDFPIFLTTRLNKVLSYYNTLHQ